MLNRFSKRATGILFPILLMLWASGLNAQALAVANTRPGSLTDGPAVTTKNVLVLFSGRFIAPVSIAFDEAVRSTFQRNPSTKVELYAETLDVARFDPERHAPVLSAYLREKFARRKLDLIITSLPQATRFALKFRKELFPDTPIVYCLSDPSELAELTPAPNVIGVPISIPWKETLDLALGVHPDTRNAVVIAGSDNLSRVYLRDTKEVFRPYEARLGFSYLTNRTLTQLLKEVAGLPPHTVVIYTTFALDGAGQIYVDAEVSGMVAKAANAPVYSVNNMFMGRGITGGHIVDISAHATRAAEIGLRILAGERPETIMVGDVPSSPRFDARQLKRWDIAESRLPAGSIILYKEPSFWKQYRLPLLILAVCILEAMLILGLLIHRRRRLAAEEALRRKTEELDQFFSVALDLLCIANTEGYFERLNPAFERTLGFTREELMARGFLDFIHPDDRQATREAMGTLASQKTLATFSNRYLSKDGAVRWMEWNAVPVGSRIYAAARDVTERKQADEAFRENQRILRQNEDDLRRLAGRLIYAQEEERTRLARELHDDLAQRLAVFAIDLGRLEQKWVEPAVPVKEGLREMKENVVKLSQDVHNLSRQLHPSILDDLGLIKAVEAECMNFSRREGVDVVFNHDTISRVIPRDVSLSLYRIIQEGLRNISKHACAEHISVSLKGTGQDLQLSIQDDGIGFDWAEVGNQPGLGFSSMRERARLIHGDLLIQSQPEKGTVITLRVPLTGEGA